MEELGPGDPQRIGGYRLLARLGAGGMGMVYLARSDRGRTVAVKLVREELAAREEFRARFRREVGAARRVGGYWTAPVLDADTEAAVPWVATGYVAGPSLQQVVGHDHGALPERSVRILAAGLAHALQDVHAAGIVHRDLKPSNVLVTIDGPRVIDFGIARALEAGAAGGEGLTVTGSLVGSPGFMAPEQVRGDRVTPACDVFALGSVLTYAATGRMPFGDVGSGVHALMFRIAQEEPDLSGVPEGIADLVRQCLRKDPAARPSLDVLLDRTGAQDTVSGGRSRDPWLPGALVAQLGRHAVGLLEVEEPEAGAGADEDTAARGGGSPEHSAVSDGGGEGAAQGGAAAAGRRPPAAGEGAPLPVTVPGVYGDPRQEAHPHPQQGSAQPYFGQGAASAPPPGTPRSPGYGYPRQSYPPYPPYGAEPEPERRSGRSTALLVVIAVIVAVGAGGSVYALLNSGAEGTGSGAAGPAPASRSASPTGSGERAADPALPSAPPSSSGAGAVPDAYLGTWAATIDNASGINTRRLIIRQGGVGEDVLTLVAEGPADGGGSYHCVFAAELSQPPHSGGPLEIGPSTVTSGEPASSCTPGDPTEVSLLPDGRLRRAQQGSGESLTYTRQ
ncbi:serine/threonine-protein kinase [Streptomyces malaysiense]|uniref:Serine/threonine protein kinase n=1 Tax=Streptomyces malaysiense TaxID=1428626 RepID=A0A1J4Q4H5_9ACTN|nr:serine/threonine-protein kinase [Streptomyces malaysiense]OIK28045.1 serine/threonine protein kinase [Streptomyces malaysiense]